MDQKLEQLLQFMQDRLQTKTFVTSGDIAAKGFSSSTINAGIAQGYIRRVGNSFSGPLQKFTLTKDAKVPAKEKQVYTMPKKEQVTNKSSRTNTQDVDFDFIREQLEKEEKPVKKSNSSSLRVQMIVVFVGIVLVILSVLVGFGTLGFLIFIIGIAALVYGIFGVMQPKMFSAQLQKIFMFFKQ